jgi:hypothetical protein
VLIIAISINGQRVQTVSRQVCTVADTVTTASIESVGASGMDPADIEATVQHLLANFHASCPDYKDPGA